MSQQSPTSLPNETPTAMANATFNELDRQLRQLHETTRQDVRITVQLVMSVVALLRDGVIRSVTDGTGAAAGPFAPPPFSPPPYAAPTFVSAHSATHPTLSAAFTAPLETFPMDHFAEPIVSSAAPVVHRSESSTITLPMEEDDRYFCITIGRRVGVFPGPW